MQSQCLPEYVSLGVCIVSCCFHTLSLVRNSPPRLEEPHSKVCQPPSQPAIFEKLWWRSCYVMLAQVPWSSSSPQRPPCGSWPRCIFKPFQDFHKQKFQKVMCKFCKFFAISTTRYDRSFLRLVPSQSRSLWLGPHLHQNHSKLLKIIPKHAVLRHVETRCSLWQRPTYWLQYIANFHATSNHLHFAMV